MKLAERGAQPERAREFCSLEMSAEPTASLAYRCSNNTGCIGVIAGPIAKVLLQEAEMAQNPHPNTPTIHITTSWDVGPIVCIAYYSRKMMMLMIHTEAKGKIISTTDSCF